MVQAIPTNYGGTQFRSRLEADWAASLDKLKIQWIYEPEGFKLSEGTWYSPDFYLPTSKAWLEIKGAHQERMSKTEQFAADLWADFWTKFDQLPESDERWTELMVYSDSSGYLDQNNPHKVNAWVDLTPPLVLLGTEPHRETNFISITGVMGSDKRYSVVASRCADCYVVSFAAIGAGLCRNCRSEHYQHSCEYCMTEFTRLPRPYQSGWGQW
jgi:hypothetical protein